MKDGGEGSGLLCNFYGGVQQSVTRCYRGGGQFCRKKSVTYFLNGPKHVLSFKCVIKLKHLYVLY